MVGGSGGGAQAAIPHPPPLPGTLSHGLLLALTTSCTATRCPTSLSGPPPALYLCPCLPLPLPAPPPSVPAPAPAPTARLNSDQLFREIETKNAFLDFETSRPNFPPTYKYVVGQYPREYSDEKQRIPSYTDRILWRSHIPNGVQPGELRALDRLVTSDHSPVTQHFVLRMRRQYILSDDAFLRRRALKFQRLISHNTTVSPSTKVCSPPPPLPLLNSPPTPPGEGQQSFGPKSIGNTRRLREFFLRFNRNCSSCSATIVWSIPPPPWGGRASLEQLKTEGGALPQNPLPPSPDQSDHRGKKRNLQ